MRAIRFALFALAAGCAALMAQQDATFTAWMKSIGAANGALRKMETKTGPEAVGQAERIAGAYEEMIGFWRQRTADDAVKDSVQGKAAAVALASAANAGDADKVATALSTLGGTCKSCHAAHRESLSEGKYRIK